MQYLAFLILAFAPLPFGSARPVWQWMWVLLIAVTAIGALSRRLLSHARLNSASGLSPAFPTVLQAGLLCLVFLGWAIVQTLFSSHFDLLAGKWPAGFTPALSAEYSIATSAYFCAHMLLFFGLILAIQNRQQARSLLWVAMLAASVYATYGLTVHFTGADTILWFKKWSSPHSVSATFVNRNNFATYAGLGLLCTVAQLIRQWMRNADIATNHKLLATRAIETFTQGGWFPLLCFFILMTALILSGSRGGSGAAIVGLLTLCLISIPATYGRVRLWLGVAFVGLLLVTISVSGDFLLTRMEVTNTADNERYLAYGAILKAIAAHPLTGFGVGRFAELFPLFRTPDITVYFDRAHNDYLEIAVTMGIPALLVLLAAFAIILRLLVRALAHAGETRPYIALGIAATVQIGLHSMLDFSMQIPAVSYAYVIILSVAVIHALRLRPAQTY